jgi:hypothetical protein
MASGALAHQRGFIMKSLHALHHTTRIVFGALAAIVLLAATSAAASASEPLTSEQFAPGWQDHARSLVNMGVVPSVDRARWYVPAILPRGEYVLVQRTGDKAEVIDGYRFKVRAGAAEKVYLFLTPGYGDVQALPVADIPALNRPAPASLQK